jgi:hypothetical protein
MKNIIITTLTLGFLIGCSGDSKMMEVVNSNINKRFTEIERKGLEIKKSELSDREASDEIMTYLKDRWERSSKNYLELAGSDSEEYYKKQNDDDYKAINEALKASENMKGDKMYFKVEYLKMNGSDTLHYGVSYFDENQNLVKQIDKK